MNDKNEVTMNNIEIMNKEIKLKEYSKPEITKLGAMQRVTLGGSIGTGDSGSVGTHKTPGT